MAQAQTYNLLHEFSNSPDGDAPYASVTMDRAGNLYGTTTYGGANGKGLVFKLSHKGDGWILSPLYSFTGGSDDGSPQTPVTIGPDGSLYGTTQGRYLGGGTVYKLSPPARACASISCPWTHTVIFNFNGADGYYANSVIFDQAGNLYGTTESGGSAGFGVVYELTPSGSGWTQTILRNFGPPPDGEKSGQRCCLRSGGEPLRYNYERWHGT